MPVLARTVETAGIATVIVTPMPEIAERFRLPRIVGVEFPFGHAFGMAGDRAMQQRVARAALALYEQVDLPARVDLEIPWPVEQSVAYRAWQPSEPSPVVRYRLEQAARRREGQGAG